MKHPTPNISGLEKERKKLLASGENTKKKNMTKENKIRLESDYLRHKLEKYPSFVGREYCLPQAKFSDKNTKGLTKCVVQFLIANNHLANEQHTTGTMIDKRQTITDCIGRQRQIGSIQWGNSRDEVGRADILAKIRIPYKDRFILVAWEIEIKFGKDRQSQKQKDYQNKIEGLDGRYDIIHTFDDFILLYDDFIKNF